MDQHDLTSALRVLVDSAVRDEVHAAVDAAIMARLPEVIRRASLPPHDTGQQLAGLTGGSLLKIRYLRSQRRLAFIRRGGEVLFGAPEVEAFLDAGLVKARSRGS